MNFKYENSRLKELYENTDSLKAEFGEDASKAFIKFKQNVIKAKDFNHFKRVFRSYRIERLKGKLNEKFSARLNKKYRVEFKWEADLMMDISIIKIQPHKYKK